MTQPKDFLARLDAHNSESDVRERLARGAYNSQKASLANEWLRRREEARALEAAARAEAREDEAVSIAREANRISEHANLISERALSKAKMANIWAAIAALIATIAIAASVFI